MAKTPTQKQPKQVQIIARAQFKSDPRKVCYQCKSSNGKDTYWCCLYDGIATGCECPAKVHCYHMDGCEKLEAERRASAAREARLEAAYAETVATIEAEQAQPERLKSEQARLADLPVRSESSVIDLVFEDGLEQLAWQKKVGLYPSDEAARRAAYVQAFNPCGL